MKRLIQLERMRYLSAAAFLPAGEIPGGQNGLKPHLPEEAKIVNACKDRKHSAHNDMEICDLYRIVLGLEFRMPQMALKHDTESGKFNEDFSC